MNDKSQDMSCQTSSISTGGGGYLFEIKAQTAFAILMLTHGRVPGFPNSEIKEIHQQTRISGKSVDDFMLVLNDLNTKSSKRTISFQVKRSIEVGKKSAVFKSVIKAAYKDFCNPEFEKDRDVLVLLCANISYQKLDAYSYVHQFSKKQLDAESFFNARAFSKEEWSIINIIRDQLQEIDK